MIKKRAGGGGDKWRPVPLHPAAVLDAGFNCLPMHHLDDLVLRSSEYLLEVEYLKAGHKRLKLPLSFEGTEKLTEKEVKEAVKRPPARIRGGGGEELCSGGDELGKRCHSVEADIVEDRGDHQGANRFRTPLDVWEEQRPEAFRQQARHVGRIGLLFDSASPNRDVLTIGILDNALSVAVLVVNLIFVELSADGRLKRREERRHDDGEIGDKVSAKALGDANPGLEDEHLLRVVRV